MYTIQIYTCTVEPLNKGHFSDLRFATEAEDACFLDQGLKLNLIIGNRTFLFLLSPSGSFVELGYIVFITFRVKGIVIETIYFICI